MNTLNNQLLKADRLAAIAKRVGFALWQLQDLEKTTAQYYVLVVHTKPGMGIAAGQELLDKAQNKTFGSTITQLVKAQKLPEALESKFKLLLSERNWLVHDSRSGSRDAVHNDQACSRLVERLDAIAEEARILLKEVGIEVEAFVKNNGVSTEKIDQLAEKILKEWHGENALYPSIERT